MKIEQAVESVKKSLVWGSWSAEQADALLTLLLEAEKVKLLEYEIIELRKHLLN